MPNAGRAERAAEVVSLRERVERMNAALDFARSALFEARHGRLTPREASAVVSVIDRARRPRREDEAYIEQIRLDALKAMGLLEGEALERVDPCVVRFDAVSGVLERLISRVRVA